MKDCLPNCRIQHLPTFSSNEIGVDILRLDLLHPIVSGNKWFKLQYYLQDALQTGKSTIASFGGAYSNHIVATAFAAKEAGLKSLGYIRGESTTHLSHTLLDARNYGMELVFVDREQYRRKEEMIQQSNDLALYWIMEGGYGILGAKGAADILHEIDITSYTHILCAVGTGTMMAGLVKAALPHQQVMGISALKNNTSLADSVNALHDNAESGKQFSIIHDYHFGGYAKHPEALLQFMQQTWLAEQLPTDIVYTSKLLFAAKDLVAKKHFAPGSRLLLIHSGGLQGNRSLPPDTLYFS
jgi:1-aminocyclopropane-1-carboxylate deaminase